MNITIASLAAAHLSCYVLRFERRAQREREREREREVKKREIDRKNKNVAKCNPIVCQPFIITQLL